MASPDDPTNIRPSSYVPSPPLRTYTDLVINPGIRQCKAKKKKSLSRVSFPADSTVDITDNTSLSIPPSIDPPLLSNPIAPPVILLSTSLPSPPLSSVPLATSPVIDHLPSSSPSDRPTIGDIVTNSLFFSPNHGNFQKGGLY